MQAGEKQIVFTLGDGVSEASERYFAEDLNFLHHLFFLLI